MPKTILLALAACVIATVIVRHGPLEPNGAGEGLAIALVWTCGLAWTGRALIRRVRRAS